MLRLDKTTLLLFIYIYNVIIIGNSPFATHLVIQLHSQRFLKYFEHLIL